MKGELDKIIEKNGKYYRMVPPDGGWGYVIAAGMVVIMIALTAPMGCYGMIYNDFFELAEISVSGIGLQSGIMFLCYSVSAFMTSSAMKRFSLRQVALFGSMLYNLGTFGSIFMDSLITFIIYGAVLAGIGSGIIITCSLTAFNMYFTKKKVFYMSICQTIISIACVLAPLVVNISMENYGFRGTQAFMCAAGLQCTVAFTLHHPVEDHLVLEEVLPTDSDVQELSPLNPKEKEAIGLQEKSATEYVVNEEKCDIQLKAEEVQVSKIRAIVEYLDLPLLRDPVFLNVCVGMSIVMVSDLTFFSLFPLHLYEVNWTNDQVANVMTLLMVGDTVARALLALFSKFYSVDSRSLFIGGATFMIVIRFVMFIPQDVTTVTAIVTAAGFFRCFIMVPSPLVVGDIVPTSKYAAAQGLSTLMMGILSFIVGPIAGAIRDATGNYLVPFHVLTGGFFLCVVPWILEIIILKSRRPKKINDNA